MNYLEELIYEAGLDDELFSALPERLAARLGARSCSLLWTSSTSETPLFAHSHYYSEDQLSKYFNEFANHDLWIIAASSTQRLNQAWLSSQAIKPDEFASSIFFNEWIRPMGDDTFHALGASMQNAQGSGVIGLHRGKSQGDFRSSHQKALDAAVVHLRRMLSIRSRLNNAERQTRIWREGFVHTPLPTMVIDQSFRIGVRNAAAELLLADSRAITEKKGGALDLVSFATGGPDTDPQRRNDKNCAPGRCLLCPRRGRQDLEGPSIATSKRKLGRLRNVKYRMH